MLRYRSVWGLLALSLPALSQSSLASVLTFDDLSGYNVAMPSTYDGFSFSGWYLDSTCSGTSGTGACTVYPYQPESTPTTIFTYNNTNAISSVGLSPFVFGGAYFTGYSGVSEQFDLYLGGNLVATSSTLTLNGSETPAFLSSGYSGKVDTVVVISNQNDVGVMDNFTYTAAAPVPEPATLSLLSLGLAFFGFNMAQRKLRSRSSVA